MYETKESLQHRYYFCVSQTLLYRVFARSIYDVHYSCASILPIFSMFKRIEVLHFEKEAQVWVDRSNSTEQFKHAVLKYIFHAIASRFEQAHSLRLFFTKTLLNDLFNILKHRKTWTSIAVIWHKFSYLTSQ